LIVLLSGFMSGGTLLCHKNGLSVSISIKAILCKAVKNRFTGSMSQLRKKLYFVTWNFNILVIDTPVMAVQYYTIWWWCC